MTVLKIFQDSNTSVRYTDCGMGMTIILLHGYLETYKIWDNFAAKLSKSYRVLVIDINGLKNTIRSMESMAIGINSLMESIQIKEAIMLGHSMGGYIMLAFAELFPDTLKSMIFLHSHSFTDSNEKKSDRIRKIDLINKGKLNLVINASLSNCFASINKRKHKVFFENIKKAAIALEPKNVIGLIIAMKDRKERTHVVESTLFPVLFIAGMHDRLLPVEKVLLCASKAKNKKIVILEQSGHMGFIEEQDHCIQEIQSFILSL